MLLAGADVPHPRVVVRGVEHRRACRSPDRRAPASGRCCRPTRTDATTCRPSGDGSSAPQRTSRFGAVSAPAARRCRRVQRVVAFERLRNRDWIGDALEAGPHGLAGLADSGSPAAGRSCASPTLVARRDLFGVRRLADVSRHLRRARLRAIGDDQISVGLVGRQHRVDDRSVARPARTSAARAPGRAPHGACAARLPARPSRAAAALRLARRAGCRSAAASVRRGDDVGQLHERAAGARVRPAR